jgi:hypothetical protein
VAKQLAEKIHIERSRIATASATRFGLGTVLLLGGIAHSLGVLQLYVAKGLPDLNRILLDVWIAEAQIIGGSLFLVASKSANPRPWLICAALAVWSYALPFLPVLIHRAKPIFWILPSVYSVLSLLVVVAGLRIESAGTRTKAVR